MKYIVAIVLFLAGLTGHAQESLRGKIVDERDEPLTGANVMIRENGQGQIAGASGMFRFANLKAGDYTLVATFVGYELTERKITIAAGDVNKIAIVLSPGKIQLEDIVVTSAPDRPVNTLSQIDIKFRPVNTAQDVLRMVPGLFIAQHAGGGKAEQIFLRGFDCDHGTDIAIDVDGLPVNMVSHAHGQGYADLHFLMPEMINLVDFDKGPYFASKGDLNTAGYVSFQTKNRLDRNFIKTEGGSFGAARLAGGINVIDGKKSNAFIASELFRQDGFFENNQKFTRFNLQGKFHTVLTRRTNLTAGFTAFSSKWNASGQIPDRAVADASISRFGSIDPTEGGNTSRYNSYITLVRNGDNGNTFEHQAFAIRYDFNLFSNFTFYLKDPVNGDQVNQKDGRWVYGYKNRYRQTGSLFGKTVKSEAGAGARFDVVNNIALDHTVRRAFLNHFQLGDIRELNANAYVSETVFLTDNFSVNAAVRVDYLNFYYHDRLKDVQSAPVGKAIVNPKLNFSYDAAENVTLFVRTGTGFHSNDARVVVAQGGYKTLPRAYALDVGADVKLTPMLLLHTALWRLDLDQEFVYSGDEGVVEPSGKTTREGIDLSARWQLNPWLFADMDVNVTRPRAKGLPEGQNRIPLAPVRTSIAGLTIRKGYGPNGSIRYRYISDRPANADNTLVAKGYFICDALFNYSQPKFEIGFSVENVFDAKWKEAQFDTRSRLKNEQQAVDEIHFTPGTPFAVKVRFTKYF